MGFHGGLKLRDHKQALSGQPIIDAPMPSHLLVSLRTNRGLEAEAQVAVGERVLKGQLMARSDDDLVSDVHAPTSGTVTAIEKRPSAAPDAALATVIKIETDGLDQWGEPLVVEGQGLSDLMRRAGLLGMGGAGFPAHAKYHKPVTTLIINGAECEPNIACDEALMLAQPDRVIRGTSLMMQAAGAEHGLIAIEDTLGGVEAALNAAIESVAANNIRVTKVPNIYPTGGEKQLIEVLTGQQVPAGQTPAVLGLLMQNVATAVAMADAHDEQRPLIDRIITVSGAAVAQPVNVRALIGTPLKDLLAVAGVDESQLDGLVIGGPMMGFAMPHADIGIDKTSNCLLALKRQEQPETAPMPCIRCGDCVQVCPQELLPQQLFWYIQGEQWEKTRSHHVSDCIECGACAYVCPSEIKLVDYYRYAKAELRYLDYKQGQSEQSKARFEAREARMARLKQERQAKRHAKTAQLKDRKAAKKEISDVLARIKKAKDENND